MRSRATVMLDPVRELIRDLPHTTLVGEDAVDRHAERLKRLTVDSFWRVDGPERRFAARYRDGYETDIATLELSLPALAHDEPCWRLYHDDDDTVSGSLLASTVERDAELTHGWRLLANRAR